MPDQDHDRAALVKRKLQIEQLLGTEFRKPSADRRDLVAEQSAINSRLSALKQGRQPSLSRSDAGAQHAAIEFAKAALIASGKPASGASLATLAELAWEVSDAMMIGWEERFGHE